MSIDAAAESIRSRIKEGGGLDATVKFDCGEDGVILIDGAEKTVSTEDGAADCTVKCELETLESLIAGDLDPTAAFMQGKIKVEGDMGVAMKLSTVL